MKNFLLALRFLTTIPWGSNQAVKEEQLSGSVIYFPLVGFLLGTILIGINLLLMSFEFDPLLINIILVIALMGLTGALHLDGLADTFDALSSGKDKESMLRIMRDPHIGTMGVLSLVSVVLLKVAILSSLSLVSKNAVLISVCVLSRWSLILPIYLFSYARDEGKAKGFFGNFSLAKLLLSALGVLLLISLIWNWKGLFVFIPVLIFTYLFSRKINRKIGGITGDSLGASLELNEVLILFSCLVVSRI